MHNSNNQILKPLAECTLSTSRKMNYPRHIVYQAWANPQYINNWWGPYGFSNTFHVYEFVKEGAWKFTMHGPDGKNYDNECEFFEIVPNELIVINHITPPQFQLRGVFETISDEQSMLTFIQIFTEQQVYDSLKDFCTEKNEENIDRLEDVLRKMDNDIAQ